MSALAEQHQRWVEARRRLSGAPMPRSRRPIIPPAPKKPKHIMIVSPSVPEQWPAYLGSAPYDYLDPNAERARSTKSNWKIITLQVCAKHNVSFQEIISTRRWPPVVVARQEAFYRLRHETDMSFKMIGMHFGDRDHTTVYYGVKKHEQQMREASAP